MVVALGRKIHAPEDVRDARDWDQRVGIKLLMMVWDYQRYA